ncbi:DUF2062 domain-containing protein [Limibacter armeniacum]|uniref:DUF2062 domain-containing protein n=1 Tax=Limibacter armeniacum TaxID=466084 RepID=UPI002FE6987C
MTEPLPKASFLKRKLIDPLLNLLKQGISPHKLALSVALGTAVGVFPLFGTSTTICLILGFLLGLNQPATQLANYFVYPLQLILLVPFIQVGTHYFGPESFSISATELSEQFTADWFGTIQRLGGVLMAAVLAWCVTMLPSSFLIYLVTKPIFKRVVRNFDSTNRNEAI